MGNIVVGGDPAPNSPSTKLRLRRGKKSAGCPCFLSEQASLWEALTLHQKFRPYVLRHLLDEGFICSVLEHGERENSLDACDGVLYFKSMEESQRGILREKLESWERAAGAGLTSSEGLNSESAFGELQLARPLHAYGFLPTLQRRLAVLRELGSAIADEHRSSCRPFHMRVRSPPPSAGGMEQGDVRLSLMMNAVALQSLSTLASLATALQALPPLPAGEGSGSGHTNVNLIRAPFAMLAVMLEEFPEQSLFKYWSPPPSEPERRVPVDPDTATASCSASSARLAVTGGLHVGWKSSATGPSVVTWQVALSEPATELTSVKVQWGAGDPANGTDQNALPLALTIEASVDGGKEWHGITGGDEAVDVALAHKATPGSSQHRYPVSLLTLRRKREDRGKKLDAVPAVTNIRLKMKGAPTSRSSGALRIYDVSINERDPCVSPSDVMTVLRQVQVFLLAQHSQDQVDLREYILRALLGVCQASCALEFELDLVRVYMQMERSRKLAGSREGAAERGGEVSPMKDSVHGDKKAKGFCSEQEGEGGLQAFVSTLLSAASRAKRLACRQDHERVIRDAGFDAALSSKWVVISERGQLVSSADSVHSHSLVHQCLRRGIWSWELSLERESSGDETTCVGVAVNPVANSCYEDSHQMWMVRCYSGETYSNGGRRNHVTCKIHPQDAVRMTLNCEAGTLSLEVNGVDQGVVFSNIPRDVHPAVCFYGITKSVRLVELKRVYGDSDSDVSESEDESDGEDASEDAYEGSMPHEDASDGKQPNLARQESATLVTSNWTGAYAVDADKANSSRRRKAARRAEEERINAAILAATVDSPSAGLLASLANFAQWYVPRAEGTVEVIDGHGAMEQRAGFEARADKRKARMPPDAEHDNWSVPRRGDPLDLEAQRYYRHHGYFGLDDQVSINDRWRMVPGATQSDRLRRMSFGWPMPPARMPHSAATGRPGSVHVRHSFGDGNMVEPRRLTHHLSAAIEALGAAANSGTSGRASENKRLPLEEPYIIQPTAAVFQKLYDLLLRSLDHLHSTASDTAASAVVSILKIMRANFCRLVDAHVDPAEVGLILEEGKYQEHNPLDKAVSSSPKGDGDKRLLPKIFRCIQGIMLRENDPLLRRATVDTFSSGLPLLMPRVEDRLHLLLGLVWHLQSQRVNREDTTRWSDSAGASPPKSVIGPHAGPCGAASIPRERVTLLWNLLKHLARTESVLQLLTLFEKEESERAVVSELLELMLTSMADKAHPLSTQEKSRFAPTLEGEASADAEDSTKCETYWEHLVASGAGGTTLNFNLLETCQQHLLYMVLNHDRAENKENLHELLLSRYGQCLLRVCCRVLSAEEDRASTDRNGQDDGDPWWQLVGVLLPPFLHGLCLCADLPGVAEGMLPSLVRLSEVLSRRIRKNSAETAVASMAEEILLQTQLTNPEEGLALAPSGWHPVRASFEVDKDSITSFAISDDGQLYSALTSSNTCALVDVGVSQGKAAWEFLLEEDSPGDECSVFGIATKPLYSRCYNSSQSLWMRRAYNGVLYNRGRQLPVTQSMSKIHPGDVVRCEVDMDEGTLRFSVNGEKQDGGFDGVEGEVFPCAGSYRSGVTIRLLKMEIMGGIGPRRGGNDDGMGAAAWDPTEISWVPAPCSKVSRGSLVSIDKKAIEVKRMNTSCVLHQAWTSRPFTSDVRHAQAQPAGADVPPPSGSSLLLASASVTPSDTRAEGALPQQQQELHETSAMRSGDRQESGNDVLEVADPEAWDWVSVRATRGFGPFDGKHGVEMEVTPVGTGRRRTTGTSMKGGSSEKRNSLRRYPMAFGLCAAHALVHERPIGVPTGSWGWWTDGSLRAHGKVLIPTMRLGSTPDEAASETLYGSEFLPLKPYDVITMVADTLEGTLRYLVNGIDAGVAFGPSGSRAVCELPDGEAPFSWDGGAVLFPSCSLTNDKQVVQVRTGGTLGTQLWPLALDLQKTVASLSGRLCATMIAGTPQDEAEIALEPWLQSPLLSGGEQASKKSTGETIEKYFAGRSWSEAWTAEGEGPHFGTRSFISWGSPSPGTTCSGILPGGGKHPPTVAEEELVGSDDQRSRSFSFSMYQLTVRIVRAVSLPQGLVLWPDSPCVRLTAIVDGRKFDSSEEVLHTTEVTSSTSKITAGESIELGAGEAKAEGAKANIETNEPVEVLSGHTAHVLVLQLPVPGAKSATLGMEKYESLPDVSLQLEVVVGRVVTARLDIDLAVLVRARLGASASELESSSGRHTSVKLSNGGEVILALDMDRVTPSSVGSQDETPLRERDVKNPRFSCDVAETCCELESDRIEVFLRSIASWGHEDYATMAVDRDNHEVSSLDKSHLTRPSSIVRPGSGLADPENSNDTSSSTGEGLGSIADRYKSTFSDLAGWLALSHPDPPFLRTALEKTGNYSFPKVEAPFLATLLKHGGLVGEALRAVEIIVATRDKEDCETSKTTTLPVPSKDMGKLWGRVRQLRAHLRTQKQHYKMLVADRLSPDGSVASPARESAGDTDEGGGKEDEGEDADKEEKGEKDEPLEESQNTAGDVYPATFVDLCIQMTERAHFLLELAPSTAQSPAAAAEGTCVLMRHLAEELPDLPNPPPARLRSRLLRWRSEDRGKEPWKDVLRVQSQLRRSSSSMIHRPRARSLGNRPTAAAGEATFVDSTSERNMSNSCIREGQAMVDGVSRDTLKHTPNLSGSLNQADLDSACNSGDESDDSSKGPLVDDETAASAAMQACAIYITTGGAVAPPRLLNRTLRIRSARAAMRTFGLEALAALLRTLAPDGQAMMSTGAPSAVHEALIFLRPAFQGVRAKRPPNKGGREVGLTNDERDSRHHYLKGLEGCSAGLLTGVQAAFEDLYGLLRALLDHTLGTGQPGLSHVLMTSWALDFESRDYRFLAHESGILPTLQSMVTLTKTASMASSTIAGLGNIRGRRETMYGNEQSGSRRQRWTPWSLESVRNGFIQGTLMARDLARHISAIPPSALPPGFLEKADLGGRPDEILGRHSMTSLIRRYSALLRVHLQHTEANLEKLEQEAALERKRMEEIARERVTRMVERGVPVLDDREARKAPEVYLTALCSWATVPFVESVACTFARGVSYSCTPTAEGESSTAASLSRNSSSKSGNYFEVTVMNPGEKTTIGVGLANPDVFPPTKQMPGWVDNSYGYHGDDGRKFGRGKTESIWPTWVDGDVIGCGFDHVRGAIWYTRNGKLLGDGFVGVYESNLVPVVGFHSNGESVRVNFGVAPFAYEGPEVVVSPAVLAEHELLKREAQGAKVLEALMNTNASSEAVFEVLDESLEEKTEGDVAEEKDLDDDDGIHVITERLSKGTRRSSGDTRWGQLYAELSPEAVIPSLKVLQRGAMSLLRFLLTVSMRQASLSNLSVSETPVTRDSSGEPSNRDKDVRKDRERDGAVVSEEERRTEGGTRAARSAMLLMPPTRERSMYGTPVEQMRAHVENLHQDIFDLILRELRLGALSLEHIASVAAGASWTRGKRAFELCLEPSNSTKSTARIANPEIQESYRHGEDRPAGVSCVSQILYKGLNGPRGDNEGTDTNAESLGLQALEIGEVEPYMFRLLALLCSVREYAVTRSQLAHPSSLRSIFSLLRVGSPRMQRCVMLLLGTVVSNMEPAVVDQCLPKQWVERDQPTAPAPCASGNTGAREEKDQHQENVGAGRSTHSYSADGLVGMLFSTVRQAYSPPIALEEDTTLEGKKSNSPPNEKPRARTSDLMVNKKQHKSICQGLLGPGYKGGFGAGILDLCLAEQSGWLLRELYKEPAWKELIARKLLLSIRTAACAIREVGRKDSPHAVSDRSHSDSPSRATPSVGAVGCIDEGLDGVVADAVAALAVIAGSSGVLYPGAAVQAKSGALGTVVSFAAGDAEAKVAFDGEYVEGCEAILVKDLEVVHAGFEADPDTPAQPVVAQLLSLLGALLRSEEVVQALEKVEAGAEGMTRATTVIMWPRLLSQTLMAILHLSMHCSDAVVAACQEGDAHAVAHLLPALLAVAVRPVELPALITAQEFGARWRAAQARMLSALRMGDEGIRTLQPMHRRPLPAPEMSPVNAKLKAKGSGATSKSVAAKERRAQSPSGTRDLFSTEESREEALLRPLRHADYPDSVSVGVMDVARPTWQQDGRGPIMTLGDAHGTWGRGWGAAMSRRRSIGGRSALEWMHENDPRRGGVLRRSMRSDLEHTMTARGRRAASAESRRDARRASIGPRRVFHEHDRLGGFAESRDEDSGALLVEFNDVTDAGTNETAHERDTNVVEAGSAGSVDSPDSGDSSQDGEGEDPNSGNMSAGGVDKPHPSLPDPSYFMRREAGFARSDGAYGGDEQVMAEDKPSTSFPVSHVLEFHGEARAERQQLGAQLSAEFGVSESTALSVVEAFGGDDGRTRRWLGASTHTQQIDTNGTPSSGLAPSSVVGGDNDPSAAIAPSDSAIVVTLIGSGDGDAMGPLAGGAEAASVPSAEEGFNLWEAEGERGGGLTPTVTAPVQNASLLCEHDLKPVLGFPRPPSGLVGPSGIVTTSFLVREVDILVPSSLVMITTSEGYAPDEPCPCATIANEMDNSVVSRQGGESLWVGIDNIDGINDPKGRLEPRHALEATVHFRDGSARPTPPEDACPRSTSIMDGEEVLVEMLDAETGLCLGKRVPIGELRHSTSFFGRELDVAGSTVQQLLHETDVAQSVLRARSLLVRLIHTLPTPAMAASGGPAGLLNITRLLAAQDLANGIAPSSIVRGDDHSSLPSTGGEQQEQHDHSNAGPLERDSKVLSSPMLDGGSLLKVLWRKVLDSPEQCVSSRDETAGSAMLGEMLAQEVLDSFHILTTTPDTMLSGDCDTLDPRLASRTCPDGFGTGGVGNEPPVLSETKANKLATGSIMHESLHPLCTPLSYGGHIKVDPSCYGMVVKLDSRSRTSSDLMRLQFFSSKEDMLNDRYPVRVMHGYVPERAVRARAKGLEFFKIEEAESTSSESTAVGVKDALSSDPVDRLDRLDRLALPPALARQSSTSTTASLGSPTPLGQTGSSRRPSLTSRAMTRAVSEIHSQMVARRKARTKESFAPVNQGYSFRSFALSGVVELWFRFDAPPGADKPPIRIVSLAGPLDVVPPGTVQTRKGLASSSVPDARHRSDEGEDLSQEELGLRALFTFFGEENAVDDSLVAEASTKSSKGAGSEDGSKGAVAGRGEKAKASLPACLAAPADVRLTSGKWCYEATVESFRGGVTSGGDEGECLLRIGWAQADLGLVRPDEIWGVHEMSLCWDTSGIGAKLGVEGLMENMRAGTSRRDVRPRPLLRTDCWLSESDEDQTQSVACSSNGAAISMPTNRNNEGVAGRDDVGTKKSVEADKRSRAEARAKGVLFPVLGSDAKQLGVGIGEEGFLWLGGSPRRRVTGALSASDVVGCAFDLDSGRVWFSVNGQWLGSGDGAMESTWLKTLGWEDREGGARGERKAVRPCFSVRGNASLTLNFGTTPFKYPPPGPEFLPVVLRNVPVAKEERPPFSASASTQLSDNRVAFAPEIVANSARSPSRSSPSSRSKSSPSPGWSLSNDWGFRFVVDPLRGVQYRVVRELELICRFGGGTRGASRSSAGSPVASQVVSIWRPKAPLGWFSVGDVASRGLLPPAGALVVRADATACVVSKPVKFRVVHQDKTTGYVVWRPMARQGQVSLGDFACAKKASKGIMAGAVRCVAAWAVESKPVIQCLWREEKKSGSQAIWLVENGLGTFFGSQTGGRLGKKEVSRCERQKRIKKKKKKKKNSSVAGDSSDEEEGERIKVQSGVGEGWGLKGVSASCITNEWCQESDVVASPFQQTSTSNVQLKVASESKSSATKNEPHNAELDTSPSQYHPGGEKKDTGAELLRKPRPSVSWASWLLSFLLNHSPLRRLAMRASLFRTLVAYIRSPGAPHRLHVLPLLTLLVRSHSEFEGLPPPLEDLSSLLSAVLRECDKLISGRGPGSTAWRAGDCPGGLQLETRWANSGLLILTDLAIASRRAQDSLRQQPAPQLLAEKELEQSGLRDVADTESNDASFKTARNSVDGKGAVRVSVPPFGTRREEGPLEEVNEGAQEEAEDVERSIANQVLVGGRTLGAHDRALLEEDLRKALLPNVEGYGAQGEASSDIGDRNSQDAEAASESLSRCLHYLLEIMDSLHALREGWPSVEAATTGSQPMYLDSLLCEAWMDAVGPAAVIESDHPFRKGTYSKTLRFPGANEVLVLLDPLSSMQEDTANLVLEGKDKTVSLTGQQEAPWNDIITFRGDFITYRFCAEADGNCGQSGLLVGDPELDDWGFRFTVVAKGPVWEETTVEGELAADSGGDTAGYEAGVQGSVGLLVELDQVHSIPRDCGIEVLGYNVKGTTFHAGTFTEGNGQTAIYVRGDRVRIVPSRQTAVHESKLCVHGECKVTMEVSDAKSDGVAQQGDQTSRSHHGEGGSSASEPKRSSETEVMPDTSADAKLERLPSNTPVLRPWGEATGVERRWHSAGRGDGGGDGDGNVMDASYVSHAATVVVGDSDVESKDESSTSSSVDGESTMWPRPTILRDMISTALPVLTADSSDISDTRSRGADNGAREVTDVPALGDLMGMESAESLATNERRSEATNGTTGEVRVGDVCVRDAIGKDIVPTGSSRLPQACAEGEGVLEETRGVKNESKLPPSWKWSVKIRAGAMCRKDRLQLFLKQRQSLEQKGPSLEEAREMMKVWTPDMDKSLLELLGAVGTKAKDEVASGRVSETLNPWCCRLSRGEAKFQQQRLTAVPAVSMYIRAAFLLRLNDRIEHVLPVVDLWSTHEASLGWQLREMNHLILPHIKNAVLEAALAVTQGPGDGVAVTLNNMKAMMSRDKGEKDLASSQCVFAQAYRQLCDTDPKLLRTVWDGERAFQINFVGEDGVDAGGVFREGMSRMVEDIFSTDLDLFILCPNGRQAIGQNNEKFVPNPHYTSPLALSMLRFVGRLMGLSLRTRLCLPFQLPGIIWKRMLGLGVDFEDLEMVDTLVCQFINAIRTCEDDGLTSDHEFREKYGERLFLTYTGSDGVERELTPGGGRRRVTFHNRWNFCRMVEHARMHEFDAQAAAMADGLSDIVPMKVLRLFTSSQLEIAVAGEPEFDMAFWKEHTDYKGYRPDDTTVELFWKVMESFSREDQSGFVRFAWGRSRLPPKAFWRVNMKLLRRNTTEESLPVSHTCFFSVELPPYTTEERMRKGLLTAIHFGMGGILNA